LEFYVGLHQPSDAKHFQRAFISISRLEDRKGPFEVGDWILDCAGFTKIKTHGGYPEPTSTFASQIRRWKMNGNLIAAVSRDYMCEPQMLAKTGMTVRQHQELTVKEYDALMAEDTGVYIIPVLQGYEPDEYVRHLGMYGERLTFGMWVGVGSVCKRNVDVRAILAVLGAIKQSRPDLRLHGFGVKKTALANSTIRHLLFSADSMAWSYAARKQGRNANDYREAESFRLSIAREPKNKQKHFLELL
jgi:hypothetical protein